MSTSSTARTERIAQELSEQLAPLQLRVEDLTVAPAGKRRIVRVLVDRDIADEGPATTAATAPVDLDLVADATRVVGAALDDGDLMGDAAYVLEVSSPGTDRPLTSPRHFRRNVGRLVRIAREGAEPVEGRIVSADADGVILLVTGPKGATSETTLTYAECGRAEIQVEFSKVGKETSDTDVDEDGEGDDA